MKRIDNNLLSTQRLYAAGLSLLFLMFVFRVCAQLIQSLYTVNWLPPFEAWHSGALSYTTLFITQIFIILFCITVITRFALGWTRAHRTTGIWALGIGVIYFGTMLFRLCVGLFLPEHDWFGAKIPTFFHLILANFVILWAWFHYQYAEKNE